MAETALPDRFQVLEEIRRSEAEVLLRARDQLLQREVVISRPAAAVVGPRDAREVERSLRQARALARVQHSGVVRLIDVLETKDGPVLVMEPIAGEALAEQLAREKRLAPEHVRSLGARICHALEAVHAAGIVHRGITASNIAIRADGSPCLSGFSFAKFGGLGQGIPGTTFMYKPGKKGAAQAQPALPPNPAPEQILGQTADARSDVFGLGWVLYEALTGESPYPRELDVERWIAPADPRRLAPGTGKALADAILKCLAPSPLKRFATAKDVREALEAGATAKAGSAGIASSRRSTIAVAAGVAVLLAGGGVYLAFDGGAGGNEVRGGDSETLSRGSAPKGLGNLRAGRAGRFSERYEQSHALLVGVGRCYIENGWNPLPNAEGDVRALGARLSELKGESWNVRTLVGPEATRENIVGEIGKICRQAKENDKVFVYYAGHGVPHENTEKTGWIIPADGESKEKDPDGSSWVRFDEFSHVFDESKAKHVLLAMDCCYSGRVASATRGTTAATYSRLFVTESAKVVITSGRGDQEVSDGVAGGNSPFAKAFLNALSRPTEGVITSEIFTDIMQQFTADEVVSHLPVMSRPPGFESSEIVFFLK